MTEPPSSFDMAHRSEDNANVDVQDSGRRFPSDDAYNIITRCPHCQTIFGETRTIKPAVIPDYTCPCCRRKITQILNHEHRRILSNPVRKYYNLYAYRCCGCGDWKANTDFNDAGRCGCRGDEPDHDPKVCTVCDMKMYRERLYDEKAGKHAQLDMINIVEEEDRDQYVQRKKARS